MFALCGLAKFLVMGKEIKSFLIIPGVTLGFTRFLLASLV